MIDNPYQSPQSTDRPPPERARPLPAELRWAHRFSTLVLAIALAVGIGFGAARIPVWSFGGLLAIGALASIATLLVIGWHYWPGTFGYAVCLLAAMVLTPADPVSFVIVAVPLCLLYFAATRAWRAYRPAN